MKVTNQLVGLQNWFQYRLKELKNSKTSDGSIPNFVPADFDAKGKTYRQLTPDGPLP